jgi:hypothetical protein
VKRATAFAGRQTSGFELAGDFMAGISTLSDNPGTTTRYSGKGGRRFPDRRHVADVEIGDHPCGWRFQ